MAVERCGIIPQRVYHDEATEFDPTHTLVMVTNFKPRVAGDDPAMWRRIRVVPFDVVVERPDTGLPARLLLGLPAVLRWCLDGYRAYEAEGLAAPEAVVLRTKEYQTSSDALGRFLDERTMSTPAGVVKARELFSEWSAWCHASGEQPGSEISFAEAMGRRGLAKKRRSGGFAYVGVALLAREVSHPGDLGGRVTWLRSVPGW